MRTLLPLLLLVAATACCALGLWQLQRLDWKTSLIAQTQANLSAPASIMPPEVIWPSIGPHNRFQRIITTGTYLPEKTSLVLASTRFGRGFWVLTPLVTADGTVYINRGFIPESRRNAPPPPPAGNVTVHGLLRLNQPHGMLFMANAPEDNRWYTRDVISMAQTAHVANAAPFFIDRADDGTETVPVGGLTITTFPNHHLQYALTWFALAALGFAGVAYMLKTSLQGWRP